MWYVASPDEAFSTFDQITGSIYGDHASTEMQYWLGVVDAETNVAATYTDGLGNHYEYNSTYFSALQIDEHDQYEPKKYFFNELKDTVRTTPPHLFDSASLYREDNSFSGNLVTVQKFYQLPFTVDLHFGYREKAWTSEETKMVNTKSNLDEAELKFNHQFTKTFVNKSGASEVKSAFLQSDTQDWTKGQRETAKYALSNMLGSIAYMYGDRMIYKDGKVVKQEPTHLFTGIPDRPDHGRGFMWDEGFHQHLISVWDMNLTQQIIASWFATTD